MKSPSDNAMKMRVTNIYNAYSVDGILAIAKSQALAKRPKRFKSGRSKRQHCVSTLYPAT